MTRSRSRARTEPFFDTDLAVAAIILVPFFVLVGAAIALAGAT